MQGIDQYSDVMEDYQDDYREDVEVVPCPMCGGDGEILGLLGNLTHYRCSHCGWNFHERT